MSFWECDKCGGIPGVTYCCTERKEMPRTTDEHADFEVWARERYPSIDLTRHGDGYAKALAKECWALWQAARRAQSVPQGYALIHKEMLRAWGVLDLVEAACIYPVAATTQSKNTAEPRPSERYKHCNAHQIQRAHGITD